MIDFRENPEVSTVIQPDFRIEDYSVDIRLSEKKGQFTITVGCKSQDVTKENILTLLEEIRGEEKKEVEVCVILLKSDKKKYTTITNLPVYQETSDNFFISKNDKAYPRPSYILHNLSIRPENEWFFYKNGYLTYRDRKIGRTDGKRIEGILVKMYNYFYPVKQTVNLDDIQKEFNSKK
jgi:hypothetical protein